MSLAEWTGVGGVLVGIIGAVSVALYRRRRTQIRGWVILVGELQDRVDRLHAAVESAEVRASTAIERAAAAEAQARVAHAQATRLGVLHDVLVAHVEALWEWIEAGATPPAPSIPTALRPYLSLPSLELVRPNDAL